MKPETPMVETRKASSGHEKRVAFEVRAAGSDEEMIVEGYAALFNNSTQLYSWLREKIAAGAFTNALKTSDTRFAINHDPNLVLGRTSNKTLEVWEDDKGLYYRAKLPNTEIGKHYYEMVRSGTISQSSFMFDIKSTKWERLSDDMDERTILEAEYLYDVAPVTYPAYQETTATARATQPETVFSPLDSKEGREAYIDSLM
jgi:HK97 family phage prohead protease